MGIYEVNSTTCKCKGQWATLTSDMRIYMAYPCTEHTLNKGNQIYYELDHLLKHITNYTTTNTNIIKYNKKYLVKIVDIKRKDTNKIIKIELNHNGEIDVANFNETKNIIYSEFNDEPMWLKIDENTIQFILVYQGCHHTIETEWA